MTKFNPRDWYQKRGSEEMVGEEEAPEQQVSNEAPTTNPSADRERNNFSNEIALLQQHSRNEGQPTPNIADDFYRSLQIGNDFGIQGKDAAQEQAEVSGMYPGVEQLGEGSEIEFAESLTNADQNRSTAFTENAIAALAQSSKTGEEAFNPMQPKTGTPTPGVEISQIGGQPGNVSNSQDLLLQQHKGRVPSKLAEILGGGDFA